MNHVLLVWAAVVAGAALGYGSRAPSGAMIGGIIAGLAVKIWLAPELSGGRWLSVVSQVLVAGAIVWNSDVSSVKSLPGMVPVALGYSAVMLAFGVLVAWGLSRWFGMDGTTALFASSPGGLSGLGLAATESDANAPLALLFHVSRITVVLLTVPFLARLLGR